MKVSPEKLAAEAEETGFRADMLELLAWKALNVRRYKGLSRT